MSLTMDKNRTRNYISGRCGGEGAGMLWDQVAAEVVFHKMQRSASPIRYIGCEGEC